MSFHYTFNPRTSPSTLSRNLLPQFIKISHRRTLRPTCLYIYSLVAIQTDIHIHTRTQSLTHDVFSLKKPHSGIILGCLVCHAFPLVFRHGYIP